MLRMKLNEARKSHQTALIVDIRCRSPRDGLLIPAEKLETYISQLITARVDGFSIVTESKHFGGSLILGEQVRNLANGLPLLRKDFFKRVEQIDESKHFGFDSVQLTLRTIGDIQLVAQMKNRAEEIGMDAILSVHNESELKEALNLKPQIIAINNRDISQLEQDEQTVATTERLAPLVPKQIFIISESGLFSRADVLRATEAGAHAVLIGTAIAKAADPIVAVQSLLGQREA